MIFFKIAFLENYDRYEAQTLRVHPLDYVVLILIDTTYYHIIVRW